MPATSNSSPSSTPSLVITSSLLLVILPLLLVAAVVVVLRPAGPSSFGFSLPPPPSTSSFNSRVPYNFSSSSSSPPYKGEDNHVSWNEEKRSSSASQTSLLAQPPSSNHSYQHLHVAPALPPSQEDIIEEDYDVEEKRLSRGSIERVEASLARARLAIREATSTSGNRSSPYSDPDYVPFGTPYRNPHVFHRSYLEMEKTFKIFVYPEGDPPLFHDGPCHLIYSTEGRFIHDMDLGNPFVTRDPEMAHMFFLPFSVTRMVHTLYTDKVRLEPVKHTIHDYVTAISRKHPYWNRSLGADHFMLSCHDWAPLVSEVVPHLYNTSTRVLCNANTSEGFNPAKDATLPEINRKHHDLMVDLGGSRPSRRTILAFFAGGVYGLHGKIRAIVYEAWHNKDKDILVYEYLPKNISYELMMKTSKFCLCPSGYEVASPRLVEAIYAECVPVIISETYVLPFSEVLDWDQFSVTVELKDIPKLKSILMSISTRKYLKLREGVKRVQRHFMVYSPPKRYDMFHMIIHSIWLRRLNVRVQDH